MKSINKVLLVGNVTREAEYKTTPSGQPIAVFGLATNREWVTTQREKKSQAEYHSIVAWGRLAEICQKHVHKGRLLYIEGYLKTRSWDNESGVRTFRTEIVATDMIILDRDKSAKSMELSVSEDEAMEAEASVFKPSQSPLSSNDQFEDLI